MSAISSTPNLRVEGRDLCLNDQVKVPIDRTRYCYTNSPSKNITIICTTAMNKEAIYTVELGSADKVKTCFDLLIKNTKTHVTLSSLAKLEPFSEGKTTFTFRDSLEFERFKCIAVSFFSEKEFKHEIEESRYTVISLAQSQEERLKSTRDALYCLDDRLYDHRIRETLATQNHPDFPGKRYPKEVDCVVGPDYSGDREQAFCISSQGIQRSKWEWQQEPGLGFSSSHLSHARKLVPSNYEEIDAWVNNRQMFDCFRDKSVWQNFLADLEQSTQNEDPTFMTIVRHVKTIIGQFEQINFSQLLEDEASNSDNNNNTQSLSKSSFIENALKTALGDKKDIQELELDQVENALNKTALTEGEIAAICMVVWLGSFNPSKIISPELEQILLKNFR